MIELGEASGSTTLANCNCLFVDTNLGTALVLYVHHYDTISDFKDMFCLEHKNCFPDLGDIKVSAFKIERRGHFYQLSDTMAMINIFGPTKADWFMSVDAEMEEVKDDAVMEEGKHNPVMEEGKDDPALEEGKDDAVMEEGKDDPALEEVKDDAALEEVKDDPAMEEVKDDPAMEEVKDDAVKTTLETGAGEKKKKKRRRRDLDERKNHKKSTKVVPQSAVLPVAVADSKIVCGNAKVDAANTEGKYMVQPASLQELKAVDHIEKSASKNMNNLDENSFKVDAIEATPVKLKKKKTTKVKSPAKSPFKVLTKSPAKDTLVDSGGQNIENETSICV